MSNVNLSSVAVDIITVVVSSAVYIMWLPGLHV